MRCLPLIFLALSMSVEAADLKNIMMHHPQDQYIEVSVPTQSDQPKTVRLQRFNFTSHQYELLANRLLHKNIYSFKTDSSEQKQLGMNGVPVLDQGWHGSCATFANTAAVDALIGKGDYISQLCHLTLGQYFEDNGQTYLSGWEGSFGYMVLNQMTEFGIIPKSKEQEVSCGGLKKYPSVSYGTSMPLHEFKPFSEMPVNFVWQPLLTLVDSLLFSVNMQPVLDNVKTSLKAGDRVTIGFLIDDSKGIGALGNYHVVNDTWVMTPDIENRLKTNKLEAGHELIITGFDDAAVSVDANGVNHQGLFTLRNSWGEKAGDLGDYYMSYDYFLLMVLEAQRIISID
jgi:hypothetical protein